MNSGKKLRALRGKKSMKEVADAVNVSVSSYKKYEYGLRCPRDEVKQRLAAYYGKTVGEIFFENVSTKVD